MRSIKTTVTYKAPEWAYCNCSAKGKDTCRFCTKNGKGHMCVLYNVPLEEVNGLIRKDVACAKCTCCDQAGCQDDTQVSPKMVMKLTMQEYRKVYKKLVSQGYPDAMADKLAQQAILGGK